MIYFYANEIVKKKSREKYVFKYVLDFFLLDY